MAKLNIKHADFHGEWNYTIKPRKSKKVTRLICLKPLVYLAIGAEPPADVCTYPDSGALVIDSLGRHGFLREADYYEGQPEPTPLLTRGRNAHI
jgi:hypothetical protein